MAGVQRVAEWEVAAVLGAANTQLWSEIHARCRSRACHRAVQAAGPAIKSKFAGATPARVGR